jgi:hypothetical protein
LLKFMLLFPNRSFLLFVSVKNKESMNLFLYTSFIKPRSLNKSRKIEPSLIILSVLNLETLKKKINARQKNRQRLLIIDCMFLSYVLFYNGYFSMNS